MFWNIVEDSKLKCTPASKQTSGVWFWSQAFVLRMASVASWCCCSLMHVLESEYNSCTRPTMHLKLYQCHQGVVRQSDVPSTDSSLMGSYPVWCNHLAHGTDGQTDHSTA